MHRRLLSIALACACVTATVQSAEPEDAQYRAELAELRAMVQSRATDIYELDFSPLRFDRVLLRDRLGAEQPYHYLAFRLRNRVTNEANVVFEERYSAYNEVLLEITKQYENLEIDRAGGGALRSTNARNIEDVELATIVERAELRVANRRVAISAWVEDENGSRFRAFDPMPEIDRDAIYHFEDRGEVRQSGFHNEVRKAIEEAVGKRLRTVDEIRALELLPYDPAVVDEDGEAQGQVHGVLIFQRLPVEGDQFKLTVLGLSNKQRFDVPDHSPDQVADYFNTRIRRRAYVMAFERLGDEYHLDRARFVEREQGWRWVPAFQRLYARQTMAYSQYFLDNIRLERETRTGDNLPVLRDERIEEAAWAYYKNVDAELASQLSTRLELLRRSRDRREAYYQAEIEARDTEVMQAPIRERMQAVLSIFDRRMRSTEAFRESLSQRLIDLSQALRARDER